MKQVITRRDHVVTFADVNVCVTNCTLFIQRTRSIRRDNSTIVIVLYYEEEIRGDKTREFYLKSIALNSLTSGSQLSGTKNLGPILS